MNIKIEKMTLSDLENIKDILLTDFDDFWSYNVFKEELENKNSHYLVAKQNNEIIGFAGIKVVLEEADIMNIVTKKSYRNCGVGKLLLESLLNFAKTLNISNIFLEVNSKNLPAIKLYKKFNFQTIGIRKNYYKEHDGIVMSKKIN